MKKFITIFTIMAFALIATGAMADVSVSKRNVWNAKQIFKHGIDVNGNVTIDGAVINMPWSKVWFVSSATGADTMGNNQGLSYSSPFATIEYAITQCRAGYGDVIVVLPSHNEAITTAAGIDFDKDAMIIVGIGEGSDMPTIDFDHADASVAVGADNVYISNLWFRPSANAITVGLDIEDGSDYVTIDGCYFYGAETATDEFAISLRTGDASNYATIKNNYFDLGAQAAESGIALVEDTQGTIIDGNVIMGDFSTACIKGITTKSERLVIQNNVLWNGDPDAALNTEPAIELLTGTTGIIRDNDIATNLTTMAASVVCDGAILFRNYYNEDVNTGTGTIFGTASADD